MTVYTGVEDKGARRREGRHSACATALDLRRKADVGSHTWLNVQRRLM